MTTTRSARATACRFGPITVTYDDRVLTPRPWTLMQSRWAAELAADAPDGPLLELCAGAGQVGLAAAVLADRDLVQVDADPVAAQYARANAALAGRADRVEVRTGRIDDALSAHERFAIILADPPYLRSADIARWPDDPVTAIDGGADGMNLVRSCVQTAGEHLLPGGRLLLQLAGEQQAAEVRAFVRTTPAGLFPVATRHHDPDRAVLLLARA